MTFSNEMDRDQAPRNVGPDLGSILFDTQYNFLLKTGCFAWDDLNSEAIVIFQVYKLSMNIMRALYCVTILGKTSNATR